MLLGKEVGAAVAVWVDGELVVNLWGGTADAAGTRPWQEDTLATVLSGTKGLTSTCVHQLAERGELDLNAPVARYWPEFGQAGKEAITIGNGDEPPIRGDRAAQRLHWTQVTDWDLVCEQLAAAEPWWEPGTAQGYHMTTFGFILGEVFRRVTGRTVGQYLRTEIAEPLGRRRPHRLVPQPSNAAAPIGSNKPHIREMLADVQCARLPHQRWPNTRRRVWPCRMGFAPDDEVGSNDLDLWRRDRVPRHQRAGVGARTGDVLQRAGPGETAQPRAHGSDPGLPGRLRPDLVLGPRVADHGWGLGYMLNQRCVNGPNPRIFGHGGLGGSFGFVDLEHRIGYAYVMNRLRRHQGQRRPTQRGTQQRDLLGARA